MVASGRLKVYTSGEPLGERALEHALGDAVLAEPVGNTPEEFSAMLKEEVARWAEVVKVSGARAE